MEADKERLIAKSSDLAPVMWIGKAGLTESVLKELDKQLKKKKLMKVKILKGALENKDKKEFAKEIAEKTKSMLVNQIGFVAVLYRE